MYIKRDLTDGYIKITSNEDYDFYVRKSTNKNWYTYAILRGTDVQSTMAGFNTKKSAIHCAETWATWMKK